MRKNNSLKKRKLMLRSIGVASIIAVPLVSTLLAASYTSGDKSPVTNKTVSEQESTSKQVQSANNQATGSQAPLSATGQSSSSTVSNADQPQTNAEPIGSAPVLSLTDLVNNEQTRINGLISQGITRTESIFAATNKSIHNSAELVSLFNIHTTLDTSSFTYTYTNTDTVFSDIYTKFRDTLHVDQWSRTKDQESERIFQEKYNTPEAAYLRVSITVAARTDATKVGHPAPIKVTIAGIPLVEYVKSEILSAFARGETEHVVPITDEQMQNYDKQLLNWRSGKVAFASDGTPILNQPAVGSQEDFHLPAFLPAKFFLVDMLFEATYTLGNKLPSGDIPMTLHIDGHQLGATTIDGFVLRTGAPTPSLHVGSVALVEQYNALKPSKIRIVREATAYFSSLSVSSANFEGLVMRHGLRLPLLPVPQHDVPVRAIQLRVIAPAMGQDWTDSELYDNLDKFMGFFFREAAPTPNEYGKRSEVRGEFRYTYSTDGVIGTDGMISVTIKMINKKYPSIAGWATIKIPTQVVNSVYNTPEGYQISAPGGVTRLTWNTFDKNSFNILNGDGAFIITSVEPPLGSIGDVAAAGHATYKLHVAPKSGISVGSPIITTLNIPFFDRNENGDLWDIIPQGETLTAILRDPSLVLHPDSKSVLTTDDFVANYGRVLNAVPSPENTWKEKTGNFYTLAISVGRIIASVKVEVPYTSPDIESLLSAVVSLHNPNLRLHESDINHLPSDLFVTTAGTITSYDAPVSWISGHVDFTVHLSLGNATRSVIMSVPYVSQFAFDQATLNQARVSVIDSTIPLTSVNALSFMHNNLWTDVGVITDVEKIGNWAENTLVTMRVHLTYGWAQRIVDLTLPYYDQATNEKNVLDNTTVEYGFSQYVLTDKLYFRNFLAYVNPDLQIGNPLINHGFGLSMFPVDGFVIHGPAQSGSYQISSVHVEQDLHDWFFNVEVVLNYGWSQRTYNLRIDDGHRGVLLRVAGASSSHPAEAAWSTNPIELLPSLAVQREFIAYSNYQHYHGSSSTAGTQSHGEFYEYESTIVQEQNDMQILKDEQTRIDAFAIRPILYEGYLGRVAGDIEDPQSRLRQEDLAMLGIQGWLNTDMFAYTISHGQVDPYRPFEVSLHAHYRSRIPGPRFGKFVSNNGVARVYMVGSDVSHGAYNIFHNGSYYDFFSSKRDAELDIRRLNGGRLTHFPSMTSFGVSRLGETLWIYAVLVGSIPENNPHWFESKPVLVHQPAAGTDSINMVSSPLTVSEANWNDLRPIDFVFEDFRVIGVTAPLEIPASGDYAIYNLSLHSEINGEVTMTVEIPFFSSAAMRHDQVRVALENSVRPTTLNEAENLKPENFVPSEGKVTAISLVNPWIDNNHAFVYYDVFVLLSDWTKVSVRVPVTYTSDLPDMGKISLGIDLLRRARVTVEDMLVSYSLKDRNLITPNIFRITAADGVTIDSVKVPYSWLTGFINVEVVLAYGRGTSRVTRTVVVPVRTVSQSEWLRRLLEATEDITITYTGHPLSGEQLPAVADLHLSKKPAQGTTGGTTVAPVVEGTIEGIAIDSDGVRTNTDTFTALKLWFTFGGHHYFRVLNWRSYTNRGPHTTDTVLLPWASTELAHILKLNPNKENIFIESAIDYDSRITLNKFLTN